MGHGDGARARSSHKSPGLTFRNCISPAGVCLADHPSAWELTHLSAASSQTRKEVRPAQVRGARGGAHQHLLSELRGAHLLSVQGVRGTQGLPGGSPHPRVPEAEGSRVPPTPAPQPLPSAGVIGSLLPQGCPSHAEPQGLETGLTWRV